MPKIDLLPCPFCGSDNVTIVKSKALGGMFLAGCTKCNVSTAFYEKEKYAAAVWNTRASGWIPCSERMPEPGDIVLVYAHVSVSDEEYWDEQFTAISVPKKMFHAFKGEEGTCWIGASNLHRLGDMISAETGFHFRGSEYVDTMRITHWMPLPKQPQRKDDTK